MFADFNRNFNKLEIDTNFTTLATKLDIWDRNV